MSQYPNLYNIVRKKHATVADVFSAIPLNISFRRSLVGNKLLEWRNLVATIAQVNLNEGIDVFIWSLHKNGMFTVKSMYKHLVSSGVRVTQEIWHMRLPLKIKIFMWYLKKGVIVTKDNLIRRYWNGDRYYSFCSCEESINHLFLHYWYVKFLWHAIHIVFGVSPPTTMNEMFSSWAKQGGPRPNLYLLTGISAFCWKYGYLEMRWFLTNVDQKLFCRYCSGERIGSDLGPSCNEVRLMRSSSFQHVELWRWQLYVSLIQMDGLLVCELVFE